MAAVKVFEGETERGAHALILRDVGLFSLFLLGVNPAALAAGGARRGAWVRD